MSHTPGPWVLGPRLHAEMLLSVMGADGQLIVNLRDGGNGIERQTANGASMWKATTFYFFLPE